MEPECPYCGGTEFAGGTISIGPPDEFGNYDSTDCPHHVVSGELQIRLNPEQAHDIRVALLLGKTEAVALGVSQDTTRVFDRSLNVLDEEFERVQARYSELEGQ